MKRQLALSLCAILVCTFALGLASYVKRAHSRAGSQLATPITDERGQPLMSVFQGIRPLKDPMQFWEARHGSAACAATDPKKVSLLDRMFRLLGPTSTSAQSGCFYEPSCYDHYAYVFLQDCAPACQSWYWTFYNDSSMANWSDGEHRDGTEGCTPLCTPVCNFARCNNP